MVETRRTPSLVISIAIFTVSVAFMAWLRLYIFRDALLTLTDGLFLLVCLWHRDLRLLWSMTAAFIAMAVVKAFFMWPVIEPAHSLDLLEWVMQRINTLVIAATVHGVVVMTRRRKEANARLGDALQTITAKNAQLRRQSDELAEHNEKLQQQGEEILEQAEELKRQNEELQQQGEELEQQGEELRAANEELGQRESMLSAVLESLRGAVDEKTAMEGICHALVSMMPGEARAAAVVELVDGMLVVRAHAHMESLALDTWPARQSFARIVMEHARTGFIDDVEARPDMTIPEPKRDTFRSILASPLLVHGRAIGAVEAYAVKPMQWTQDHFRIIEWVAAQCSILLELLRSRKEVQELNASLEKRVHERTAEANTRAEQLRRLAGDLTTAEQRERRRLAEILHDGLQQLLVGAKYHLDVLKVEAGTEALARGIDHVVSLLDESLSASRSLTYELCPPVLAQGTLAQALQWLARWAKEKHGMAVELNADQSLDTKKESVRTLIFQSVRELLLNARKHAKVDRAVVAMESRAGMLEIAVSDAGAGFNPECLKTGAKTAGGMGLFSIRERAELLGGRLELSSRQGLGTCVRLSIPFQDHPPSGGGPAQPPAS